jgi:hypothetical protein
VYPKKYGFIDIARGMGFDVVFSYNGMKLDLQWTGRQLLQEQYITVTL